MSRSRAIGLSLLAWVFVWVFWLAMTRGSHPTFPLAVIVTTCLVSAYAAAAFLNHLVLLPRFWQTRLRARYGLALAASMLVLTALALLIIRVSYLRMWGPDADPNGAYKHFAIDFFGMAVHVTIAAGVVWVAHRAGGQADSNRANSATTPLVGEKPDPDAYRVRQR